MKYYRISYIILFSFLLGNFYIFSINAQTSNLKFASLPVIADTIYHLDKTQILPSTIKLSSKYGIKYHYKLDQNLKRLVIFRSSEGTLIDTLALSYRCLAFPLDQSYALLDSTSLIKKDKAIYIGYEYDLFSESQSNDIISARGLDYDGSFSRGFSLGNSQSLLLNSNFNLQMQGDLGDDIKIRAAISDDNIPIQPEGNTQVLQEFDKIFIQVERRGSRITAGDFEEIKNDAYFLKYLKKLKGLKVEQQFSINDESNANITGSFAQSQGKFSRQTMATIEGNQGPYKLVGNNNELFLIVRSGTEKIYYDGRLLKRGIDQDYVISYDRAEVSFTPKTLITKDSRIVIEFEYLDRNYQRSSIIANADYNVGDFDFSLSYYSEADSKNLQQDIQLDSSDIAVLNEIGDDTSLAFRAGDRLYEGEFSTDLILYERIDSLGGIFSYSTDPDEVLYTVAFSNVGEGNGSYEIYTENLTNGRVYRYVGSGGSFDPLTPLVAPQSRQMINLSAVYNPDSTARVIRTDLIMSNLDNNTFSQIDQNDNVGFAGYFSIEDSYKIPKTKLTISPSLSYELRGGDFKPINPYRSPEFQRDWNRNSQLDSANINQQLVTGSLILSNKNFSSGYSLKSFQQESLFEGIKQVASISYKKAGFDLLAKIDQTDAKNSTEESSFLRPTIAITAPLSKSKKWLARFDLLSEKNEVKLLNQEELLATSFSFDQYDWNIIADINKDLAITGGYQYRVDRIAEGEELNDAFSAHKWNINATWNVKKWSQLKLDVNYRTLEVLKPDQVNQTAGSNAVGRLDYNLTLLKGGIRSTTSYLVGSGQELKREFEFVQVERGEGNYIWVDANQDNVQDIAEFISDTQSDTANFVIVTIFNNEFIRTNANTLTQSLRINASKFTDAKKSKFQDYLSRLSWVSNLKLNQKTQRTSDATDIQFFNFNVLDPNIVRYDESWNNNLFINRGKKNWDLQLGHRKFTNKFTQITGLETKQIQEYNSKLRLSPAKRIDFIFEWRSTDQKNESELFEEREYDIETRFWNPTLSIRPNNNTRIDIDYSQSDKKHLQETSSPYFDKSLGLELSYRAAKKFSLQSMLSYTEVSYEGDLSSPVSFELLSGLRPGQNFIWTVDYKKRMISNVDLVLRYEGRKTGTSNVIHTARAQIKATF